jgi:Leucine-rich repeat (LRR) protein
MALLHKFPNLVTLSLHGNHLKMLPMMSELKLISLDVTNNPLEIDHHLLDSLFSVQTLENLCIDGSEDEFERILENLPNLKTLNKKKIIREKKIDNNNPFSMKMK